MKCKKCGEEIVDGVCPKCGDKKVNNNRYLKLFLVFLTVVIIGVTIAFIIKRDNDIEKGTTPSGIPNQANVK